MPVKRVANKSNSCDCIGSGLHTPLWGLIALIVGILMLGQNLGWWGFWNVGAWTAVFIIIGLSILFNKK